MRVVRWVACAALIASAAVVGSPPASAFVGACTVSGTASVSSLTIVPNPAAMTILLSLSCPAAFDHAGSWGLAAVATSPFTSCATVGPGSGAFVGGGGPDGSVTGGSFTFTSVGPAVTVVGDLSTSGDPNPHLFTAQLVATPNSVCAGPTTVNLAGFATITDAVPSLNPQSPAGACTVQMVRTYTPGVTMVPVAQTGGAAGSLDCLGLGDMTGNWSFFSTAAGTDSCTHGLGTFTIVSGTTTNHGSITSGSIDYARIGHHMALVGTIVTTAAVPPHRFTALLAWAPQQFPCGLSPVTLAAMTGLGAIVDG